MGATIKPPPLV